MLDPGQGIMTKSQPVDFLGLFDVEKRFLYSRRYLLVANAGLTLSMLHVRARTARRESKTKKNIDVKILTHFSLTRACFAWNLAILLDLAMN